MPGQAVPSRFYPQPSNMGLLQGGGGDILLRISGLRDLSLVQFLPLIFLFFFRLGLLRQETLTIMKRPEVGFR